MDLWLGGHELLYSRQSDPQSIMRNVTTDQGLQQSQAETKKKIRRLQELLSLQAASAKLSGCDKDKTFIPELSPPMG